MMGFIAFNSSKNIHIYFVIRIVHLLIRSVFKMYVVSEIIDN